MHNRYNPDAIAHTVNSHIAKERKTQEFLRDGFRINGEGFLADAVIAIGTQLMGIATIPALALTALVKGLVSWFSNRKQTMRCPRCNGDGYVSENDLDRLYYEGYDVEGWIPGWCRLCMGSGRVELDFHNYRDVGNTPREQSMWWLYE